MQKENPLSFEQRVYALVESIPHGKISTYGQLARKAGAPGGARAVGNALRKYLGWDGGNCYRVVNSDGKVGAYCGGGNGSEKQKLKIEKLKKLGCIVNEKNRIINFWEMLW